MKRGITISNMRRMQKYFTGFILALFLLVPSIAGAATFAGTDVYSLGADETVSDNLYVGAGDTTIGGTIEGDVLSAGGNVALSGSVRDDTALVGGNITLVGDVGGDARIAGGNLVIGSPISGELVAVGGTIKVLGDTTVAGDVVLAGGSLTFAGQSEGDGQFTGGQVTINGTIEGDVSIEAQDHIVLGENARIGGDLTYKGSREDILEQRDGAVVAGNVSFEQRISPVGKEDIAKGLTALFNVLSVAKLLMVLVVGIIAVLMFRTFSQATVDDALSHPGWNLLRGFLFLVAVPIAAIIFFATVLGALVGLIALLIYALFLITAMVYGGIIFGAGLYRAIKKEEITVSWQHALVGILLLGVIKFVPFIGWIFGLFFFLLALGAVMNVTYQKLWLKS